MGKLNLIITADYEIFGNGSGCVDACMINPSETMMQIAEKQGAKVCFFVDVCEYWAFKEVFEEGLTKENNALKIEEQLKGAVKRGHDVQLHFHPQWLDYQYENGEWKLNQNYWRLSSVERLEGWSIEKLFTEGKTTLESILKPVKPDYSCDVFRAGAWCIQPEKDALKVMRNLGFRIESTVAPNKVYDDGRTIYDFTGSPDLPKWKIQKTVTKSDDTGVILEYPIFTTKISGYHSFKFNLIKATRKLSNKPKGCKAISDNQYKKSFFKKLSDSISSQIKMLNSSDGVSFEEMKYITERAISKYKNINEELPLVMIGHPKTFGNDLEFDKYLAWVKSKPEINFSQY